MIKMIKIGYWYSPREPELPMPVATDLGFDPEVVTYLESAEPLHRWRGFSSCRLCDKRGNGTTCDSDGTYQWPTGLSHYLTEHGVQLDPEFIRHIKEQTGE
jgi:hypothetical protein